MRSWIARSGLVLAVWSAGCGGSSVEQGQSAAGSAPPPVSMTTAGTPSTSAAGIGGQPAPAAAGSGGSMVSVTPPPSAAGAGGSAPVAGSSGGAGQAAPTSNARLPCDVADVVGRQCLSCHGSPTNLGAPMPLVTYADFHRPAVTDATKQVYELVGVRVVDTQRPMPPRANGKISAQDQKVLTTWSSQGGPSLPPTAADCGH